MRIKAQVLEVQRREWADKKTGEIKGTNSVYVMESSTSPMLQVLEVEIGQATANVGTVVEIALKECRGLFAGKPQFRGELVTNGDAKAAPQK